MLRLVVISVALASSVAAQQQAAPAPLDPDLARRFQWRSIGPDRGGRSIAVSGVRGRPSEAYFGAVGGGLWKTTDAGQNWAPVTDGQVTSASVGAVAVSESNPDVVYIGMGESCIRGNIMPGDGIYKSVDAGKTWAHVGFRNVDAISRIRVHPTNPDIVYAALFGKYGAPSEERGIFKSTDGGRSWRKVLYRDAKTGAVDLSIDPSNPNVMYAALWEAYRFEYQMSSGGASSGLFKSTDGGETWTEITRNPGMPSGLVGRIGVSVSGADPNRVYALVENENGGLFSSDNAGATWTLVNSNRNIRQRAFYYTHVHADPKSKETVYLLNVSAYRSTDGGKTINNVGGGTHSDHHDLWIDPDNAQHLVIGNDGGGAVATTATPPNWTAQDIPTPQYYHVATTKHVPYHVCGAQQDGSTVCVSNLNASNGGGAGGGRGAGGGGRGGDGGGGGGGRGGAAVPEPYGAGGSEAGYIAPDPKDLDVFFAGGVNGTFMTRINRRTGERREVNPYPRMYHGEPAVEIRERWQWTYPIIFSPVDPNALYTSSQRVWKTTNGGQTWQAISGDLTRHDPKTMQRSGGPITGDMNGPEVYGTVFAIAPSKRDVNVIWAGSDDGLIHVTRDGGRTWTNVTPTTMPEFGRVSIIDASAFETGRAYAAVKRQLLDDRAPYIFRTADFGRTWTKITNGIPANHYVHTVREDHTRPGLLYAGTQQGVQVSYDDGANWQSLSLNLPSVPVSDMIVEANDLVISTHGRGFYVLDDIAPIRQFSAAVASEPSVVLFKPEPAVRSAGAATFSYWLKRPAQSLKFEVLDTRGTLLTTIETPPAGGAAGAAAGGGRAGGGGGGGEGGRGGGRGGGGGPSLSPGLNSVSWNLLYPGATTFPGMILWGASTAGPAAPPGEYTVRMTADGRAQTQTFKVVRHPLFPATDADLLAQFNLAIRIRDKVSEANESVVQIRSIEEQVADRLSKSTDAPLRTTGATLSKNLDAVEESIYQVRNQSGQDPLNFPIKVNNRLATLLRSVTTGDGAPIGNAEPIFNDLVGELKVETDRLTRVIDTDLAAFNRELARLGLPAVIARPVVRM